METSVKRRGMWVVSGAALSGRWLMEWVREPDDRSDVMGRVGFTVGCLALVVATVATEGWAGLLLCVVGLLLTFAWMHFSPKSPARKAGKQASDSVEGVPVGGTQASEDRRSVPEGASSAGTGTRPSDVQDVTRDDASGPENARSGDREDSPDLRRSAVQGGVPADEGPASGDVHAGHSDGFAVQAERPGAVHLTNADDLHIRVSSTGTPEPEVVSSRSSEAVQVVDKVVDKVSDGWFAAYIRRHEDAEERIEQDIAQAEAETSQEALESEQESEPVQLELQEDSPRPATSNPPLSLLKEQMSAEKIALQDRMLMEHLLTAMSVRDLAEKHDMPSSTIHTWITQAKKRQMETLKHTRKQDPITPKDPFAGS